MISQVKVAVIMCVIKMAITLHALVANTGDLIRMENLVQNVSL